MAKRWQNSSRNNALVTIGKSLVERNIMENYDLQICLNALVKE